MSERKLLITEDGSHTIYIPALNETYHSTHGAIQESTYVFILQGLQFLLEKENKKTAAVFEVGFGTGLNALLSILFAGRNDCSIRYQSIEAFPLQNTEIEKLNYPSLLKEQQTEEAFEKIHTCAWSEWHVIFPYFQLHKVNQKIQDFDMSEGFDVCYFDAFAPSRQPEMWELLILRKIYEGMNPGGVFVTYSAMGQLKRDLRKAGFEVETLPGPLGKKEMVRAIKT